MKSGDMRMSVCLEVPYDDDDDMDGDVERTERRKHHSLPNVNSMCSSTTQPSIVIVLLAPDLAAKK